MSSLPRARPVQQPSGNRRRQEAPKVKREQITVACEACRQRKTKCSGERPECKACLDRDQLCEYAAAPGLTPVAAIKRKYESLQAETADEHELLGLLRTGSDEDASKVLAYLRSSDDVQATLHQARNAPDESSDPVALDLPGRPPLPQDASQYSLQATCASMDAPSIYPELSDSDGTMPWALPIEPYFDHRPQWGEYLAAQDNQEDSERPRTDQDTQSSHDRPTKVSRRTKR